MLLLKKKCHSLFFISLNTNTMRQISSLYPISKPCWFIIIIRVYISFEGPSFVFASTFAVWWRSGGATMVASVAKLSVLSAPYERLFAMWFSVGFLRKSGTLLTEVKLWESAVYKHPNERIHYNVHQTKIQWVQFTFTQSMNAFMNNR